MVSFSYEQPLNLFFLFVIPLIIFIHVVSLRFARTQALKFANFDAIGKIKGIDFFSKNIVILLVNILIIFLLSFSLAGFTVHTERDASTHSFIIAIDNSQSMEANDLEPTRLEAAKSAAAKFVNSAPLGTKFGVIAFSGNSFVEQRLTDRKTLVRDAIANIQISDISGTALSEAMNTATNLLLSEETKAIILISDGQINVGSVAETIDYANENEVIIHSISIGTAEGGSTSFGLSKVDEEALQALAYNTQGEHFSTTSVDELDQSFSDAISLTRRKVGINFSEYLMMGAIILFVLNYFLLNTRYRRMP